MEAENGGGCRKHVLHLAQSAPATTSVLLHLDPILSSLWRLPIIRPCEIGSFADEPSSMEIRILTKTQGRGTFSRNGFRCHMRCEAKISPVPARCHADRTWPTEAAGAE